jgi:hypothetical protein
LAKVERRKKRAEKDEVSSSNSSERGKRFIHLVSVDGPKLPKNKTPKKKIQASEPEKKTPEENK